MKNNLIKTAVAVAAASSMMLSAVTGFAAAANTVTTYNSDATISVKSTVSGVANGTIVTYLASKLGTVSTGEDIVYIDQQTSNGGDMTFNYKLKSAVASAEVKYGSDNPETATELNTDVGKAVRVAGIAVTKDNGVKNVEVAEKVGSNNSTTALITLDGRYELASVTVNGETVADPQNTVEIPYAENPTLDITTKATEGAQFVVYVPDTNLEFAYTDEAGIEYQVMGVVGQFAGAATEYGIYVEKDGAAFKLDGKLADGREAGYYPAVAVAAADNGYFAVQLAADAFDPGTYTLTPYMVVNGETIKAGSSATVNK